ncbi:MAG: (d)CMP kinase [Gammaproteobacteria bacterium]|nr:(d)CMP kinase [Gammaproteobacteria bacterium]MDE0715155.1 (d)CMP kinase [Gammaproteobacteria bacterium]
MNGEAVPVVAIDGPSGSGKGTVALRVARALGWHYLDSGALYRVLALYAVRREVPLDDESQLAELAGSLPLRFDQGKAMLVGADVENEIRSEQAGDRASRVAPLPAVRRALLSWQRNCAMPPGLVADGRDMGTVVFPDADCKIFLTASVEQRAQRRFNQLRQKGFDVNIHRLFEEISERDRRDAGRRVSPLRPAEDAVLLDTTELTIDQAVEVVLGLADRSRGKARG